MKKGFPKNVGKISGKKEFTNPSLAKNENIGTIVIGFTGNWMNMNIDAITG
jgi:hypothetical protein